MVVFLSIMFRSRLKVYDEALVSESALLPLHGMFGNESEYDLKLEVSGDHLSALVGAVFQLCG